MIAESTVMGEKNKAEPASNIENRLRQLRMAKGLSQGELARMAGVTRQAIYAIESNKYLPTTAVALSLSGALDCRVEDLFSLVSTGEVIEGDLIGTRKGGPADLAHMRVKVARIGERIVVRPVSTLGGILNYTVPADGLIIGNAGASHRMARSRSRVRVRLLRDRRIIDQEIAVAGCDPAIFLAGEYLRRQQDKTTLVGWTLGSAAALEALKSGEVHVAGLHVVDAKSGESNLPYLRKHLPGDGFTVVTFATWEEGLMVRAGNPKGIRDVGDLARRDVGIVNREKGSGARLLLDGKLSAGGVAPTEVKGYERTAASHFEVARQIAEGHADTGVGIGSAAKLLGLDFVPLQRERYDLVIPTPFLTRHPALANLLDTIVSRAFRTEIEALGGYDTSETGKVRSLRGE